MRDPEDSAAAATWEVNLTAGPGYGKISGMSRQPASEGEDRLARRFAESGVQDGREAYRALLRALRASNPDAFAQATRHYEMHVQPAGGAGGDPLEAWIEYGRLLCGLSAEGKLLSIDVEGRALPYRSPYTPGALLLYAPEDSRHDVTATVVPVQPSAAQQATLGLLVEKRLSL